MIFVCKVNDNNFYQYSSSLTFQSIVFYVDNSAMLWYRTLGQCSFRRNHLENETEFYHRAKNECKQLVIMHTNQWLIWQLQRCTVLWSRWKHSQHPYAIVFERQWRRVEIQLARVLWYRSNAQWSDRCHHEIWYKSLSSLRCTQSIWMASAIETKTIKSISRDGFEF